MALVQRKARLDLGKGRNAIEVGVAQLSELAGATSENTALICQSNRMVLSAINLDDSFFVVFTVEVVRLDEGLDHAGGSLVLDATDAQLAKGSIAKTVHGAAFKQDHGVVATGADLDDLVFRLLGDV